MQKKLIYQGAEAKIWLEDGRIIKERINKIYRVKQLDKKIIKFRTKREAKVIKKLENKVLVPKIFNVFPDKGIIIMQYIRGEKLSDVLEKTDYKNIARLLAKIIANIHNANIIHQDLTTSNFILYDNEIYVIDFGLSFFSQEIEHKAVDLHLLKQALESKHYTLYKEFYTIFIKEYDKLAFSSKDILKRLEKVELRGRNKGK